MSDPLVINYSTMRSRIFLTRRFDELRLDSMTYAACIIVGQLLKLVSNIAPRDDIGLCSSIHLHHYSEFLLQYTRSSTRRLLDYCYNQATIASFHVIISVPVYRVHGYLHCLL